MKSYWSSQKYMYSVHTLHPHTDTKWVVDDIVELWVIVRHMHKQHKKKILFDYIILCSASSFVVPLLITKNFQQQMNFQRIESRLIYH